MMKLRWIFIALVVVAASAAAARAQQPSPQSAPSPATRPDQQPQARTPTSQQTPAQTKAAQEGFVPVEQLPQPEDRIPAPALVGTAYAFVWVALFAYIWSVWRRLSTVERELQAVSRRVDTGSHRS
jgi:CcmD family protein